MVTREHAFPVGVMLITILFPAILGAGYTRFTRMTVHQEASHQAQFYFKKLQVSEISQILIDYNAYLQAGSYFPDWGYACGNGYDEAEDAHWSPFWNASVQYISQKYEKPWSDDAKGLIAFLFGVISHGVADTLWHSLNMDQGFIQAMQHTNYQGSYPRAHSDADIGGEFLISRFQKLDYLSNHWKVPTHDLIQIYKMTNRTVTASQLGVCTMVGFALVQVNHVIGRFLAPAWMQRSNFLVEEFFTYFRGGLTSLSLGIAECWSEAVKWLVDGKQTTKCAHMGSNDQGPVRRMSDHYITTKCADVTAFFVGKLETSKHTSLRTTTASMLATGICLASSYIAPSIYDRGILKAISTLWIQMKNIAFSWGGNNCQLPEQYIKSEQDYSRFGSSIVTGDFDNDGKLDVLVGSPGFSGIYPQMGAVYFISGQGNLKTANTIENIGIRITGPTETGAEFGYSMAVIDLNKDGIPDVAISAPHVGQSKDQQDGEVYVRFGGTNFTTKGWDLVIRGRLARPFPPDRRLILLGQKLYSEDLDGDGYPDLIVASPRSTLVHGGHQRGMVQAFLSSSNHRGSISFLQADWTLGGSFNYDLFGSSVFVQGRDMFIGAPGSQLDNLVNSGTVYHYKLSDSVQGGRPILVGEITGEDKDGQFGSFITSITIGSKQFLSISSKSDTSNSTDKIFSNLPGVFIPSNREGYQAGSVHLYDLETFTLTSTLGGSGALGHFGSQVQGFANKGVFLSEPIVHAEQGRLYYFSSDTLDRATRAQDYDLCWRGRDHERFGSQFVMANLDGNGKMELLVGSTSDPWNQRWSKGFLDGGLYILWNVV